MVQGVQKSSSGSSSTKEARERAHHVNMSIQKELYIVNIRQLASETKETVETQKNIQAKKESEPE